VREAVGLPQSDDWVDVHNAPMGKNLFRKLASEGAFPVYRMGNRHVVRRRDLDAYVETQRVEPKAPARSHAPAGVACSSERVAPTDDPIARELAAGRLRIVKKSR